jgi:hypothetical protein
LLGGNAQIAIVSRLRSMTPELTTGADKLVCCVAAVHSRSSELGQPRPSDGTGGMSALRLIAAECWHYRRRRSGPRTGLPRCTLVSGRMLNRPRADCRTGHRSKLGCRTVRFQAAAWPTAVRLR